MLAIADPVTPDTTSVTDAALARFCGLRDALPFLLLAHETRDGGLICEHRHGSGRPVFYRVTPAGAIEPDRVLDRRTLRFTPAALPAGIA